jgi:hypothetical protein
VSADITPYEDPTLNETGHYGAAIEKNKHQSKKINYYSAR